MQLNNVSLFGAFYHYIFSILQIKLIIFFYFLYAWKIFLKVTHAKFKSWYKKIYICCVFSASIIYLSIPLLVLRYQGQLESE